MTELLVMIPIAACSICLESYDAEQWRELDRVDVPDDASPEEHESRLCPCGQRMTALRELAAEPVYMRAELYDELHPDNERTTTRAIEVVDDEVSSRTLVLLAAAALALAAALVWGWLRGS